MIKDELWDKIIESFEVGRYEEVKNEDVESGSQAPMPKAPSRRAPGNAHVYRDSPGRKKN